MTDFDAIIFDLDGVIIDSEPLHERAQRLVFYHYRIDVPPAAFAHFKGKSVQDVFTTVVREYAHVPLDADELIALKQRLYDELQKEVQPVDGALPFLEQLARQGVTLGLTTSATPTNQAFAFDKFGLHAYFSAVVTAEDVTRPKPDPEPYLTTAERLHAAPPDCLVIEDSTIGVESARRAGCTVAGLTTSFSAEDLAAAGAHITVDSFDELAHTLRLDAV